MLEWLKNSLMKKAGKFIKEHLLLFTQNFTITLGNRIADFVFYYTLFKLLGLL